MSTRDVTRFVTLGAFGFGIGCAVFYDTRASQERVAGRYVEQLKAHGWEVQQREYETTVSGAEKRTFEEVEITARRGNFVYNVLFESHEYYDPPRPGVHVAVHVFKSSKKTPASCGSEEKAALVEFSHYGGKELGGDLEASPLPGKASGACVTGYPARGGIPGTGLYLRREAHRAWMGGQADL